MHISSPAVSSPSRRWKVSGAPSSGSVSPSLHFSPAFIPAAPQHSLTIVIVTNQYGLSAAPLHPPPPPPPPHPMLLSSFLNTDLTDSPAKSVFLGPGFNRGPISPCHSSLGPNSQAERHHRPAVPSAAVILMALSKGAVYVCRRLLIEILDFAVRAVVENDKLELKLRQTRLKIYINYYFIIDRVHKKMKSKMQSNLHLHLRRGV